jgi:hypothetical protein
MAAGDERFPLQDGASMSNEWFFRRISVAPADWQREEKPEHDWYTDMEYEESEGILMEPSLFERAVLRFEDDGSWALDVFDWSNKRQEYHCARGTWRETSEAELVLELERPSPYQRVISATASDARFKLTLEIDFHRLQQYFLGNWSLFFDRKAHVPFPESWIEQLANSEFEQQAISAIDRALESEAPEDVTRHLWEAILERRFPSWHYDKPFILREALRHWGLRDARSPGYELTARAMAAFSERHDLGRFIRHVASEG